MLVFATGTCAIAGVAVEGSGTYDDSAVRELVSLTGFAKTTRIVGTY